jgi:catechol 2,3-dioxygenase-like lactoylglutathione lyase family enzyme
LQEFLYQLLTYSLFFVKMSDLAVLQPNDALDAAMAKWEAENGIDETEDDEDDDIEVLETEDDPKKFHRTLFIPDESFDHVVLGTSDVERSIEDFEQMTGVRPFVVVSHHGLGTKSARVSFDNASFLEILGPDPKQSATPFSTKLSQIEAGRMIPVHYAVRNSEATTRLKKEFLPDLGFTVDHVTMVAKDNFKPWLWDVVFLQNHSEGGILPYFIQWRALHASERLPVVGTIDKVVVRAPSDSKLHKVLSDPVEGLEVERGEEHFEISFTSDKGTHTFSTSSPMGIVFPEEGGLPIRKGSFQ